MKKKLQAQLAALYLGLGVTVANAAVDVTAVKTEIEGAAAPIATIGAAVLIVMVGIKVYKWVRRAL